MVANWKPYLYLAAVSTCTDADPVVLANTSPVVCSVSTGAAAAPFKGRGDVTTALPVQAAEKRLERPSEPVAVPLARLYTTSAPVVVSLSICN